MRLRELGAAVGWYGLMTAVFFWPLLLGNIIAQSDILYSYPPWTALKPDGFTAPANSFLSDQTREFLTFFLVARDALAHLELPLWNPTIMAGTPLLANSQSALLFPLNLGHYLLPPPMGFSVASVLKVMLSGLAAYVFGRHLRMSKVSALLTGTVYAFATFHVFWLNHPHTNVTLLFPLVLLAVDRLVRSPDSRSVALLGLVVALQLFGGHVELVFLNAVAAGLYWLFRMVSSGPAARPWPPRAVALGSGYALAFCTAGLVELPLLEFLTQSATWEVRGADNPFFLHPVGLAALVVPKLFAFPEWGNAPIIYHSLNPFVSIPALLLAVFGLVFRPQRTAIFFGLLAVFGVLVVFKVGPLFWLITQLPIFKQTPNFYMVTYVVLALSVLAGFGLDKVLGRDASIANRGALTFTPLCLGAAGCLLLAAWQALPGLTEVLAEHVKGLGAAQPEAVMTEASTSLFTSAWLAAATGALALVSLRTPRYGAYGLILLAFVDLHFAGSDWNPTLPRHLAMPGTPPAVEVLRRDTDTFRIAAVGAMPPNTAVYAGLQDVRGYDVPVAHRYHVFFQEALGGQASWWIYDLPTVSPETLPLLGLLNVKYLVSTMTLPAPAELIYDAEVRIYRNPFFMPRAFFVDGAEHADGPAQALQRVLSLGRNLATTAVVEGLPQQQPAQSDVEAQVTLQRYEPQRVDVVIDTPSPGMLVLADTFYPGWKAYLDGNEVPVYPTDYLLRGVLVGPGRHMVRFMYEPWSFKVGMLLTVLGLIYIAWQLGPTGRRRRLPSSDRTPAR